MQVARIFQVLAILQSSRNGKSVTEIEATLIDRGFEVQKRTVYRDIDALQTAGFPVNCDEGAPGGPRGRSWSEKTWTARGGWGESRGWFRLF